LVFGISIRKRPPDEVRMKGKGQFRKLPALSPTQPIPMQDRQSMLALNITSPISSRKIPKARSPVATVIEIANTAMRLLAVT
jgi:hypothetical protein